MRIGVTQGYLPWIQVKLSTIELLDGICWSDVKLLAIESRERLCWSDVKLLAIR